MVLSISSGPMRIDATTRALVTGASRGIGLALDVERLEAMTRVNWLGTVYTVKAALGQLVDRASGHVVIVSSGAGLRAFPWAAGYGATKAAQRAFGEALRHELSGSGVSVTTVFPGEIATHLHDHEKDSMPDWYRGGSRAADAGRLATAVLRAAEEDRRGGGITPVRPPLRLHRL